MYNPETYRKRLIDDKIELYLKGTDAICIVGMRWTGKTTTGEAHCKSEISLADSNNNFSNRRLAQASPSFVLKGETPRLIDEWQEVPQIYDAVRFACDSMEGYGHFILTGSSRGNFAKSKDGLTDEIYHSGTGRIANLTLESMTLYETGDSTGEVSLRSLFDELPESFPTRQIEINELVRFCVRGGWPKNINCTMDTARIMPMHYIQKIAEEDYNDLPSVKYRRSADKIMMALRAIAQLESTVSGVTDYLKAIRENSDHRLSKNTLESYIDDFIKMFILYQQPAFVIPSSKTGSKVLKSPKIRFSDPSLSIAALNYTPERLLSNWEAFEKFFDCLCVHDLKVYADAMGATLYHMMEEHGSSADALIQLNDDRIGCFKHVVSAVEIDSAAKQLLRMKNMLTSAGHDCVLLCVICGMSDAVYVRPDGIVVLPLTSLKP